MPKIQILPLLVGCFFITACQSYQTIPEIAGEKLTSFDDKAFSEVLKTYVDSHGLVNYQELKNNRDSLDKVVANIALLERNSYEEWSEKHKIAFLINAYNALTLRLIIDNYPIQSSVLQSLVYPQNSIRQIPGAWDKIQFTVMGEKMTLDHIEHQILRKQFSEPRIHMALVCASISCPYLRGEAYTAENLDAQLHDQTLNFLQNPLQFRVDRSNLVVHMSSIFKWFAEDFVKLHGKKTIQGHSNPSSAVLNFINQYLSSPEKEFIDLGAYSISYLDYNWELNEQK